MRQQLDDAGLTALVDELLLAARARRLLLVVDQFEELLTHTSSDQRVRFAQLLRPALGGPLQLVATLRSEFLNQLLVNTDLAVLPAHTYPLRPLRREALRAVVEGPSRLAGIGVDDDLVARLVADTDSGEALPLLAFTLAQLANGVGRGGQLSTALYDQLGGVQGALTRLADTSLADATVVTGRSAQKIIAGLLQLVTVDEQGHPTRWRVFRAQLTEPVVQELDVFIKRRLLITDTENGSLVVEVAHEAFLSAWVPLAQAIEKNTSALRARRTIEQAAAEWNDTDRSPARLWERGQLAAAVTDTGARLSRDLITDHVGLSLTARAFLRASIRRDSIQRGRAITVLSVLLVLALAAAGIAIIQQRATAQQRNILISRQAAGQALDLRAINPNLAAQLGLVAYRIAPTTEARSSLLSIFADPYAIQLTGHTAGVKGVAFSPDGHTLATSSDDRTVRLWDARVLSHLSPLGTLTGHNSYVPSVAFSSDGRTLATGSDDTTARLWDIGDPHQPHLLGILVGHTGVVISVAFSPDGRTLATSSFDETVRLWDLKDPHQPSLLGTVVGHSVAFSSDGRTLATASGDNTTQLWDISDPRQPSPLGTLTGHTKNVASVAFSPDGHTLATASQDATARLWDISDPRQPHTLGTLTGHTADVNSVAFSSDGRTLATASGDNATRLWDISDPRQPSPLGTLTGHTKNVASVAFSPDGHTLATASWDTSVRLWETNVNIIVPRICNITLAITKSEWDKYLPGLEYKSPCL